MSTLSVKVAEEIAARGISIREASRQIGISNNNILGFLGGRTITYLTAYKICKWLDVPFTTSIDSIFDHLLNVGAIAGALNREPEVVKYWIGIGKEVEAGAEVSEEFKFWLEFALMKIDRMKEKGLIQEE